MGKITEQEPTYEVLEDDDDEVITLDFDDQTIYSKEEVLITKELNTNEELKDVSATFPPKPEPSFRDELQDYLLNSVTSKAVASLLQKHKDLDTELDLLLEKQRIGRLGDMIDSDIDKIMNNRRLELKDCFAGSNIKYERIPEWAKTYVKEYIKNMVHGLSILVDDSE